MAILFGKDNSLNSSKMINRTQAQQIIKKNIKRNPSKTMDTYKTFGQVLVEDVFAKANQPPFDKAAMDGFTICSDETKNRLKIVGEIAATAQRQKRCQLGTTYSICTGGVVPKNCLKIVPKELVRKTGNLVILPDDIKVIAQNYCKRGEDFEKGDLLFAKGEKLNTIKVASIISAGNSQIKVFKKCSVAVITTGDEVVDVVEKEGQIVNSNKALLKGLLKRQKCTFIHCPDDAQAIARAIKRACLRADLVITTGGASVGSFDFVATALSQLGARALFAKVAIKPAMPNSFYNLDKKPIFCFPGNPVAVLLSYLLFAKTCINYIDGGEFKSEFKRLQLNEKVEIKPSHRERFMPAIVEKEKLKMQKTNGPADLFSMSRVDCFCRVPKRTKTLPKGSFQEVLYLQ